MRLDALVHRQDACETAPVTETPRAPGDKALLACSMREPGLARVVTRKNAIAAAVIALAAAALLLLGALTPPAASGKTLGELITDAARAKVCTCPKNLCAAKVGPDVDASPDLNMWMARILTEGFLGDGNADYGRVMGLSEPEYITLGDALLQETPLLISSAAWTALENGVSVNTKSVYEALIIDYLAFDLYDTGESDPFDPSVFNEFLVDFYDFDLTMIGDYMRDTGLLDSSVMTGETLDPKTPIDPQLEAADSISFGLQQLQILDKDLIKPYVESLVSAATIANAAEERIYLLQCMRGDIMKSSNPDYALVDAIDEVVGCYYQAAESYFKTQQFNSMTKTVWDEMLGLLALENPVFEGIKLAASALDVLCGNDTRATNNLRLAMVYTVGLYAKTSLQNAHMTYLPYRGASDEVERAAAKGFVSCYYGYLEFQLFATDLAKDWIEANANLNFGSLSNVIWSRQNSDNARFANEQCDHDAWTYSTYLKNLATNTQIYLNLYTQDCDCGCQKVSFSQRSDDAGRQDAADDAGKDGDDPSGSSRSVDSEETDSGEPQDVPEIDYSIERHASDEPDSDSEADDAAVTPQVDADAGERDQLVSPDDPDSVFYLRNANGDDVVRVTLATGYDRFETISKEHRYVYEKSPDAGHGGIFCTVHYSEITMEEFFEAADEYFLDPEAHSVVEHDDTINGRRVIWHVVTDGTGDWRQTSYFAWLTDGVTKVSVEYYGPDTAEDPDATDLMTEALFLEAVSRVEFL